MSRIFEEQNGNENDDEIAGAQRAKTARKPATAGSSRGGPRSLFLRRPRPLRLKNQSEAAGEAGTLHAPAKEKPAQAERSRTCRIGHRRPPLQRPRQDGIGFVDR